MKEEEQNRQFEAYEQDKEQLFQSSLLDSDADTGCFELSIDGFGVTDD